MASPSSRYSSEATTTETGIEIKRFRLQVKQREFANCPADIAVFGGGAGGGKTRALIQEPISRELHKVRNFNGVIFRRSYPEITNPGGLWDEAGEVYPYAEGFGVFGQHEYRWPRYHSKIAFRHLQDADSVHDYQGAQICYLAFDELTHFTEAQFWYLLSRNRSMCGVTPYVRCTCNPDPGWVKSLLAPWVDDGYPGQRAQSGELRWFIRVGGEIRWVDRDTPDAKSLTFIRATVFDNAELLSRNPEYLANLKALLPVERARLLDGDWNVRREGLVYPQFESCLVERPGTSFASPSVGGIDFGFNHPFAAVWGHLDGDDVLWLTGCRYRRETTTPVHAEGLPKGVKWWCDPSRPDTIKELRNLGHSNAVPCVHMAVRGGAGGPRTPVLYGIDLVTQRMRTGRLKIVRESCLPLVRELATYCYDPERPSEEPVKEDDHACDALRYLVVGLDRGKARPQAEPVVRPNLEDASLWA